MPFWGALNAFPGRINATKTSNTDDTTCTIRVSAKPAAAA